MWRLRVNFAVKPENMRECDAPAVATLTWKVEVADVQAVKIFVVEGASAPRLFIHSGASGTAETGKWARAGQAFILKDGGETKQLGKLVHPTDKMLTIHTTQLHSSRRMKFDVPKNNQPQRLRRQQ